MIASQFKLDREGGAVLLRCLLGLASVATAISGLAAVSAMILIGCVWADAVTGWLCRRQGPKTISTTALERYADAACFVVSPVALAFACSGPSRLLAMSGVVFVIAAIYRLARFDVEGLVGGAYQGLPVTYNGYIFPTTALAIYVVNSGAALAFCLTMLATSVLMVSRQVKIPEA